MKRFESIFKMWTSIKPFSLIRAILFFAFAPVFFIFLTTSSASAAPTTINGVVSGIPEGSYGIAWAERYVDGEWVEITSSYTKDLSSTGVYSVSLGEVSGASVRIWIQVTSSGFGSVSGTDTFTVNSASMTKNFSLANSNVTVQVSNPLACSSGYLESKVTTSGVSEKFSSWIAMNETGTVKLALPSGYSFNLNGKCNGDISFTSAITASNTNQNLNITIPTPNITGTISGITATGTISGVVQSRLSDGVTTKWSPIKYGFSTNSSGQFALNLPTGTYRLAAFPNFESGNSTNFVNSYSDSFTVANSPILVNFVMSTDPNLVLTVTPTIVASSSWVNIEQKFTHPLKGNYFDYAYGASLDKEGKLKFYLEPGTYRATIYPNENGDGYVQTVGSEFTVTDSGSDVLQTIALTKANLKFVISPSENAKWGNVTLTASNGDEYSGYINESGISFISVPSGTYKVIISPGNPSSSGGYTVLSSLVVSGSEQTSNVTLSTGNVSGTISPITDSRNGYVRVEEKITGLKSYWKGLKVWGQINESGAFNLSLPAGTYRIWAESNDGSFVSSPSAEFTVESSNIVVNFTLRTANLTGTVTPNNKAANGYVYVTAYQESLSLNDYVTSAPILSDGSYKFYLPDGTYKFRATSGSQWPNYFGVESDWITLSSAPQTLNLSLVIANVTGTVNPVSKSKSGYGYVEKLINGNWEGTSISFEVNESGEYSTYLPLGTYRATIFPGPEANGVFQLRSDSFTVVSGSNTFDFTLPSSNFSVTINPTSKSPGTWVSIEKYQSQGYYQHYEGTNVNRDGIVEAYLPDGRYRLRIYPNGKDYVETVSNNFDIPSTSEFPVPTSIALETPNVYGTVTPKEYAARGMACIEKKEVENFFQQSCQSLDMNGNYGFKVPNGTYRVIITPVSVLYAYKGGGVYLDGAVMNSQYTITTSEEFEIAGGTRVVNIALSTGNLSGTISAVDKAAGGWIGVVKTDGTYAQWTNYRAQISDTGKYALQLPQGKYRLQIYPREDAVGVVRTETEEFTIGNSNLVFNATLDIPNVTGIISPTTKSANGWIYAEQFACRCGWSGWTGAPGIASSSSIKSDGSYALKLDPGLSRVVANPRYNATGVTKTYSDSFTVTAGETRTVSFTLSEGNLRGTISSLANSVGGWVRVEKKIGNYWNWTNIGTNVLEDGTYRLQVEDGTYRLVASPGWRASGVVETTSDEFTMAGSSQIVDLTLQAPNLTGTVTNLSAAIDNSKLRGMQAKDWGAAYGYILKKNGSEYNWINKYITIFGDGKYSTYLPNGTYQIYIYQVSEIVSGLTRVTTSDIEVSGSKVFNFGLTESNLRGTVGPISASAWGSICAQKENGVNWDWAGCENIRGDGTYGISVSAGTYRVIAYPRWDSLGYSKIISETATVASSGITTLNITLQSANVKLIINDLDGKPNFNGHVSVFDSSGNYVDTGKGWISQLGKVGFYLVPGTYKLEIQPANERSGVRTTVNITVPSSGVLESTITLSAGNIQGLVRNSSSTNIACAFVTATATDQTTVKTIAKNDGTFTLNLTPSVIWTISAVDPATGQVGTSTITPNGTSSNAVTVTTS